MLSTTWFHRKKHFKIHFNSIFTCLIRDSDLNTTFFTSYSIFSFFYYKNFRKIVINLCASSALVQILCTFRTLVELKCTFCALGQFFRFDKPFHSLHSVGLNCKNVCFLSFGREKISRDHWVQNSHWYSPFRAIFFFKLFRLVLKFSANMPHT